MRKRCPGFAVGALTLLAVSPLAAQTDPSGSWRTWHTTHFRVHAQARNASLAQKAAVEAERAYALLARELTPPRGTIDLALHDNVDFSNGFTTVFPSSRIAIFLTPPAGDPILGPYDDWLRMVITHELTHVFHLDRTRGLWRVVQRVLGRAPGSFPNSYQPSWVSEGLATYYETRLTTSGRLRAGLHDQLLASAAAARRWPAPGDATLLSPRWPGGFRPYAWGSHFFQWQSEARGDSVVGRFVERTSKNLWPVLFLFPGVSPAMRGAGGVGVDSAWRALRAEWQVRGAGESRGRVIVRALRGEPRPRVSPDGRRLAYVQADGRSDLRLVVRDVGSGNVIATHPVNGDVAPWWRGDTLYVSQVDFTSPVEIRTALYRWRPGGPWERVPGADRLGRPFTGGSGPLMAVDLAAHSSAVVALDGDGRRPVPVPDAEAWGFLAGSHDGEWLAGARHARGQWDLVAWNRGSPAAAVAITDDGALDDDPVWTTGGDLVFASERSGLPQILAYKMNTRSLVQVTDEPTGARQPAPAPDGSLFYATILWDGWAVMHAQPSERAAPRPRPRPAFAQDTGAVAQSRSTGYRPWPSLAPRFWIPLWHDVGSAGRFAGAATYGADAIGRTSYFAQLAMAPATRRVQGSLSMSHQRWKAFRLDASYTASWDSLRSRRGLVLLPDSTVDTVRVTYGDLEQLATVGGTIRWRRWRSQLSARLGAELEADRLVVDRIDQGPAGLRLSRDRFTFAGPVVSVAAHHLSFPALAISPENGAAMAALYRYRWDLDTPGWWSEGRGGASGYLALPFPGFAHWVLAVHGSAGVRGGPSADGYDLGGASGQAIEVVPGYQAGPGRRLFPLRGYPAVGTPFTRAAIGAIELRVPVALVAKAVWKLPMGVDRVSVTGFAEAGRGWRVQPPGGNPCAVVLAAGEELNACALRDVGGEVVVDAAIPQDISFRARVGVGIPLTPGLYTRSGVARWYLAFGTAF
ncbi:MAG TPA: hypothetical protein VJL31_17460 [Gemmatimonadales bacterium]|nr:hypothetical protein [Gemmatimonadales bacterium]